MAPKRILNFFLQKAVESASFLLNALDGFYYLILNTNWYVT